MSISAAVYSHKGYVRNNNEDNFFLNGIFIDKDEMNTGIHTCSDSDAVCQLYAICDGMGGETNGKQASYDAVAALAALKDKLAGASREKLRDLIDDYTAEINKKILGYGLHGHMGTTIAMLLIYNNEAYIAHMGDSRVYLIREKEIIVLTSDHSEAGRLLALGFINDEQYRTHPMRNAIIRYLGMDYPDMKVTAVIQGPLPIQRRDRFLICSDGLSKLVLSQEIIEKAAGKQAAEAVTSLVKCALDAGGTDNITAMIIDIAPAGRLRRKAENLIHMFAAGSAQSKSGTNDKQPEGK